MNVKLSLRNAGRYDTARAGQIGASHQELVNLSGRLSAFGNAPHHQRLSSTAICRKKIEFVSNSGKIVKVGRHDEISYESLTSGGENLRMRRAELARQRFVIRTRIQFQLEFGRNVFFGPKETHG